MDSSFQEQDSSWAPKQDMSLLCRVCANQQDYLIPIFEGEGLDHDMPTKMQKYLPVKVRETDKLPIQMCYQCASTIIAWSDLVTNCLEADKKLKGMLKINEKNAERKETESTLDDDTYDDSTHFDDTGDVGGGDDASDEDFEKEIKQLISDAGVELPSTSKNTRSTRKRKAEIVSKKSDTKRSKSDTSKAGLLKPKEEVQSGGEDRCDRGRTRKLPYHSCRSDEYKSNDPTELLSENELFDKCANCNQRFRSKSELRYHSRSCQVDWEKQNVLMDEEGNVTYQCRVCKLVWKTSLGLELHMAAHSDEKSNISRRILMSSKNKLIRRNDDIKSLKTEFKELNYSDGGQHSGEEIELIHCDYCEKSFISKPELIVHIRYCKKKINRELEKHKIIVDGNISYQCSLCKAILKRKYSLKLHMDSHTGGKMFICDLCGKQFSTRSYLRIHTNQVHLQIKTNEKHVCKICNKPYATRRNLTVHERLHTGEKLYVCEICGKAFNENSTLSAHKMIHPEVTECRLKCQHCQKKFYSSTKLKRHLRVHSDERQFSCDICFRSFKFKHAIREHKLAIHSGDARPYVCEMCNASYKTLSYLRKHEKSHQMRVVGIMNIQEDIHSSSFTG